MKKAFIFIFTIASFSCFAQGNKPVLGYFSLDTAGTNKKAPPLKQPELKAYSKDEGTNNLTDPKDNPPQIKPMDKIVPAENKNKPK